MTELVLAEWQKFALAVLVGLLVGLEREHARLEREKPHFFAGVRTFPLISLLGCTLALLSTGALAGLFAIGFAGVVALTLVVYAFSAYRGDIGLTTEVAVLLVYLTGGLIYWDQIWLGVAIGVLVTVLLALRHALHTLVARIEREDIYAALKFIVVSAVVLPLLPNETFGPLDVINPYQLWLMVVFVSAISFSGYVAIKLFGHQRGIWITSLLGGLVSTTAVTMSFSERSRESSAMARHLALGIVIASSTMYFRVLLEVMAFNSILAGDVWLRLVLLMAVGLGGGVYLWRTVHSGGQDTANFSNPFRLWPAIQIAILFGVILLLTTAANQFLGESGIYAASFLSGLTKIDPIALSLSQLAGDEISYQVAGKALLLATTANVAAKMGLVTALGAPGLRRSALPVLGVMALASLGLVLGW